jgi:hypothetical protein
MTGLRERPLPAAEETLSSPQHECDWPCRLAADLPAASKSSSRCGRPAAYHGSTCPILSVGSWLALTLLLPVQGFTEHYHVCRHARRPNWQSPSLRWNRIMLHSSGMPLVSIDQPLITDNLFTAPSPPSKAVSSLAARTSASPKAPRVSTSSSAERVTTNLQVRVRTWIGTIVPAMGSWIRENKPLAVTLVGAALLLVILRIIAARANDKEYYINGSGKASSSSSSSGWNTNVKIFQGQIQRVLDGVVRPTLENRGVPMPFPPPSEPVNGEQVNGSNMLQSGWGVCTLHSKRRLGKSNYVQYEFDLPQADYKLSLELGQKISLCCLDNNSNVAQGDFFPYTPSVTPKPGSFSILLPNHVSAPEMNTFEIGADAADLGRVLKQDLKVGDEVALRPAGSSRLSYRGQFLPVTDMVYIAVGGVGIVPVLDQVRAVLPKGSSSVQSVTVVWINDAARDFDINAELLEREYYKYSSRLAVSCIVCDLRPSSLTQQVRAASLQQVPEVAQPVGASAGRGSRFDSNYPEPASAPLPEAVIGDNVEINTAVPNYQPGTMAVLSAPRHISDRLLEYLIDRGYPRDTVCAL